MKTNHLIMILGIVVVLLAILVGVLAWQHNQPEPLSTSTPVPTATITPTATPSVAPTPSEARLGDVIVVTSPQQGDTVTSPLTVKGSARGSYYFEGVFPIKLLDSAGQELARGQAQAQGEWMTNDYVPFTATLTFAKPATATGSLVLEKDNPSGLPANAQILVVPIAFK